MSLSDRWRERREALHSEKVKLEKERDSLLEQKKRDMANINREALAFAESIMDSPPQNDYSSLDLNIDRPKPSGPSMEEENDARLLNINEGTGSTIESSSYDMSEEEAIDILKDDFHI